LIRQIVFAQSIERNRNMHNKTIIIHDKFIGKVDVLKSFEKIRGNTRKGVEVEYLRTTKTA